MTRFGTDKRGDIHHCPDGEENVHEAHYLCGCNPDAHYDETTKRWTWGHHPLKHYDLKPLEIQDD